MKVVILAGGLGTRMREETEFRPKPMVEVGGKPILWHIMKIYASYGHTEFVICSGYKGDVIKNYFYNYSAMNMDFTLKLGDHKSAIFHGSQDELDWTVTLADTGFDTPTGGRIKRVQHYIGNEPFLCTYGDGVAPVDINRLVEHHFAGNTTATITSSKPTSRFGVVRASSEGLVESFEENPKLESPVNIGYFVFSPRIFDFLTEESSLESDTLPALAAEQQLSVFEHFGFWLPMDTQRELHVLQEMWTAADPPWKIW